MCVINWMLCDMKQLSKQDVNKLTARELKDNLPFQITCDGDVIAVVISPSDKAKYDGSIFPTIRA